MDDVFAFVVPASFFFIFNRNEPGLKTRPSKPAAVAAVLLSVLILAALALKYRAAGSLIWFFPSAWLFVLASFNMLTGLNSAGYYFYEVVFMAVIASFLMTAPGPFTPYVFSVSFFTFLLMASPAYSRLLTGGGFYASFLFMIFSVFFVKTLILGALPPLISAPAAALCGIFICVRKCGTIEYYTEEKNLMAAAAVLYTALILQCFLAAILKNPFFAG